MNTNDELAPPAFAANTPDTEIAAWVAGRTATPADRRALAALLPESHPLHAGRSANETARLRAFMLATFARIGLPDEAIPVVLEELESGNEPVLVAAAARALRGLVERPGDVAPLLTAAAEAMRFADEPVDLDEYRPHRWAAVVTSARAEIAATLAWLAAAQPGRTLTSCCHHPAPGGPEVRLGDLADLELEDQDGRRSRFDEYLRGAPTVVAFFYTRCDNPKKCSLTISKLVELRRLAHARGQGDVRIAAFTYDPRYDTPDRLRTFGSRRGFTFTDDARLLRTPEGLDRLRSALALEVGFGQSTVNRHRVELFVLDGRGGVEAVFTRRLWRADEVCDVLGRLRERTRRRPLRAVGALAGVLPALGLVLLPKCPACLAVYATMLGLGGVYGSGMRAALVPILLALIAVHLAAVAVRARRTERFIALGVSSAGSVLVTVGIVLADSRGVAIVGLLMVAVGALLGVGISSARGRRSALLRGIES